MKDKLLALSLVMIISMCGCGNTSTVDKIIEKNSQTNKQNVGGNNTDGDDIDSDNSEMKNKDTNIYDSENITTNDTDNSEDVEIVDPEKTEIIDLTELSSAMVYGQVNDMIMNCDDYLGKTVRMKGVFSAYEGEQKTYFACVVADALACCQQGIEFELKGKHKYPDDYPGVGEEITVVGTFDKYIEDGLTFIYLDKAKFE
ncbi:MAG: hypothetical protein E7254_08550 [Lachnospiraceae bacterium]|nr:hypothetical protein [Lachnospiraceae bacterium]